TVNHPQGLATGQGNLYVADTENNLIRAIDLSSFDVTTIVGTGETSNDRGGARALARLADAYVDDAFGAAHRAHATTEGVAHELPAVAGLLLEDEVSTLSGLLREPSRPFVVLLGGAKVSDKIDVIDASTGGTNEGRLYSYGANGASDRAFGSLASGSTGTIDRGIRLINGTGMTLTQFMLQYDGEQWRMGTNNDAINSLAVAYRFFAPATGSLDAAGYLDLPWAAFDSPRVNTDPGSAFSLDGNAPINREAEITAWVGPIDWMPDDELWIRFRDLNDGGFDHGLGVDDFRFEAVPEPSTIGLLAVGVLWLGVWRFRRRGARSVG
ncbi:hypothetical protein LCGC14_3032200, partial [marine sediment metagenome]